MSGIVLDAGGLIALERDDRRVYSFVRMVFARGGRVIIPATALAQVTRNVARQVRLWRIAGFHDTEVVSLDKGHARAVGDLLAKSRTSDIVDAHVVICARMGDFEVLTSDPLDLKRLDPTLRIVAV